MKIKTTKFTNDTEIMMLVSLMTDNDVELERYTFYNESAVVKIQPELEKTLNAIPAFLERVYNSGKNGEALTFEETEIPV